jgi:phosphoribosyl 1,2-cyclic phosphate phosphodiesterase
VRYHYLIDHVNEEGIYYAQLDFKILKNDFGSVDFAGLKWNYVTYTQSGMKVNGYILGDLAYVSDIREYSEEVIKGLKGVKTLILGALRYEISKGHFNIDEAIAFAREVGAEKTYLTHFGHELSHEETSKKLPSNVKLAYDGLELTFNAVKN